MIGFSNFEYPVRDDIDLIIMYPMSGVHSGDAVIHKADCQHSRNKKVYKDNLPIHRDSYIGYDDWFHVAPCARVKGAKPNPISFT